MFPFKGNESVARFDVYFLRRALTSHSQEMGDASHGDGV
jgi:hypothetical protein